MIFETLKQSQKRLKEERKQDAEYLRLCLAKTSKQVGLLSPDQWYTSGDTMLTVATILEQNSYLIKAADAIRFFEKPWHFEGDMRELAEAIESEQENAK